MKKGEEGEQNILTDFASDFNFKAEHKMRKQKAKREPKSFVFPILVMFFIIFCVSIHKYVFN